MPRVYSALRVIAYLTLISSLFVQPCHAMHPELAIPDRVSSDLKACREIMRLGEKYHVEGLFSQEFREGQCQIDRMEVAIAVELLTQKIAERVATEGVGAIDRKDLSILGDLREELSGEMLLAQSRAFQNKYQALGTNLHALTKNISLSGSMVGVLQGSFNNNPKNYGEAVGRGDLVFEFRIGDGTIAVVDLEATGGNGLDAKIGNFSVLNGVAGSTDDRVRFREAWVEHSAFDDRLVITAGKIDLTNYFDANSVANDENSQFLGGAFVNSAVIGAADIGPGIRLNARLADPLIIGFGYGSGDSDTSDIFDHGFGIAELDYKFRSGDKEGNYRAYVTIDGTLVESDPDSGLPVSNKVRRKTSFGYGVSMDQQLTDALTLFGRFGWRDRDAYVTKSAWSAGFQYAGPLPQRKDDVLAFAFGQVLADAGNGALAGMEITGQEKLIEAYYKAQVNELISVSPHLQYLINPMGNKSTNNVFVLGLRTQITF